MAGRKLPQILEDSPLDQLFNWAGFSAKKDKTMLPKNYLVEPSKNCFIPDGDKVLPRSGTQIKFQGANPILNDPTIGGYKKFKNFFGVEMDVKAYRDATAGEQVYVLFQGVYVPITITPNTAFNGTGRIYFSTYTDSTLNLAQEKRIPRLVWVNGYKHTDGKGRAISWTGGISPIANIAGNIISLPAGQTWRQLGFTEYFLNGALTGQIHVTIKGVDYFSVTLAQLDTNSLTLNTPPSAVIGDVVTSTVEVDELVAPMDHLKQNKNYMYYGNWMYRQWWMSNQYGRPSVTRKLESNASQDDLTIDPSTNYTGSGRHTIKLTIVSTTPAINTNIQEFFGFGTGNGNWNISGYTGNNLKHIYKLVAVTDYIITGVGASMSPPAGNPAWIDQVFVGGTSGAIGVAIGGQYALSFVAPMRMISGTFINGETITGQATGASVQVLSVQTANYFQLFKDGVQITTAPFNGFPPHFMFQADLNGTPFSTSIVLTDGLTFTFANPVQLKAGDYYQLTLQQQASAPDQFTWQEDNGTVSGPFPLNTSVPMPNPNNTIRKGIQVYWSQNDGHLVGDYWLIEVNQQVLRPWANFYYSIDVTSQDSVRRPGEGYVYSLPSPFWTSDTLEESIYVNTANGEWGYTTPTLSADLKSEDISFVPLKQVGASKVLYPYLTGHNRNDLLFIDENKNLTSIGRMQLIERIQMDDLSDFVRNAFRANSWINGSIIFQDDKTWLTSPEDKIMLCYDERMKYWQPPQFIPNLGLLTIIGTDLFTHSWLNTATRSLNDPTAIGDDGVEYEVIIRSSTYDHGDRWNLKETNTGFWEGRVDHAPPMKMKAYFDVDGCSDVKETDIVPIFCSDINNNGQFGGGNDGVHPHGSGTTIATNYARYTWDTIGVHHFYFSSLEFRCRAKEHPYEVLSMGFNLAESKYNNKDYKSKQLLPL